MSTPDSDTIELIRAAWKLIERHGGIWNRADIQAHTGLSRQRVYDLVRQDSFPDPATTIGSQPAWFAHEVLAYRTRHDTQR